MFAGQNPIPWFIANFAQRLKELRTARSLTQTRLAELLAISPRVYSRWETGDVTPHFDTIGRLADILGVSLDEIAGRKDVSSEAAIKNPELNRLCRKVDQLSDEDQQALVIVLDSLVKPSRVSKVMAEM
jgi:transcriptional regulator with XRE-family HTH domain